MWMMIIGCISLQHDLQWRITEEVMKIWAEIYRHKILSSGGPLWSEMKLLNNITHHSVIKHNVVSGSSQSAHLPVMAFRQYKFSTSSWLQWLITML